MTNTNTTEKNLTGYPSIDKPWLKYYNEEAINAKVPKCSIYQNIYNGNADHLSDIALLYFGKKITYKTLFNEIDRAAKALTAHGVKRYDNVAICMPAVPETIYLILALNKIGANANMLNPMFTEQQLADRINETGATLLFVLNELYGTIKNVVPKTSIITVVSCTAINSLGFFVKIIKGAKNIPNTIPWNDFVKRGKGTNINVPEYGKKQSAIIVYSSGTTGASKGIQLTNDSINATIVEYGSGVYGFSRQEKYFAEIPIWFSTGIVTSILVPLKYGVTVILEPIYDFEIFNDHIIKYSPNFLITSTGLIEYLMEKHPIMAAAKEFRYFCIGGEYISSSREEKVNQWLNDNNNMYVLQKGYGMCECGGTITNTISQCNVIGSAGIPTPHVVVAAFDLNTGAELKYGERGEIRVLTPCRMIGYYKNPEATEKYFHTDEKGRVWACTGDMGYVTDDGSVFIDGRINDSYINEQGETIYLFDIERAVLASGLARQCKAVVSEIDGRVVHVAHTVLDNGVSSSEAMEQIYAFCQSRLKPNHVPSLFKLHNDALPISPSGKLDASKMKSDTDGIVKME